MSQSKHSFLFQHIQNDQLILLILNANGQNGHNHYKKNVLWLPKYQQLKVNFWQQILNQLPKFLVANWQLQPGSRELFATKKKIGNKIALFLATHNQQQNILNLVTIRSNLRVHRNHFSSKIWQQNRQQIKKYPILTNLVLATIYFGSKKS